jgi:phenylpyruvate tautomerase PptA (4-oxalocrotonate tautomerase family)
MAGHDFTASPAPGILGAPRRKPESRAMPIVDVEIVGDVTNFPAGALAQRLADEAARVFASPPASTWVRVHTLAREGYAENDSAVAPSDLPVFVMVLKRQAPERAELAREVSALTQAIARIVGRPPGRVHIEYALAAAGRVAFGGTLVE